MLAIDPLGAVAGTVASITGFYTILMGVAIGSVVGQTFNGTAMPQAVGFVASEPVFPPRRVRNAERYSGKGRRRGGPSAHG
jgi:hypothetical protein